MSRVGLQSGRELLSARVGVRHVYPVASDVSRRSRRRRRLRDREGQNSKNDESGDAVWVEIEEGHGFGSGILNSFEWNKAERETEMERELRGDFGEIESGNAYSFEGAGDLKECFFFILFFQRFPDLFI